jgi:hypothetical protein
MGHTRVIYTDATTAEAATALKSNGYLEGNQGGLFTSHSSPVKVYVVWGKSPYYPEIVARLEFTPRIQIHLKCREGGAELTEMVSATAAGLRSLCPGTRIVAYDADRGEQVPS